MLYGVVTILIANSDFLWSKNLQLFPAGVLGILAAGYLYGGIMIFREKNNISIDTAKKYEIYCYITSIIYIVLPLLSSNDVLNSYYSRLIFFVYENGFIFGMPLISLAAAIALYRKRKESKIPAKYYKRLFSVCILLVMYSIFFVLASIIHKLGALAGG